MAVPVTEGVAEVDGVTEGVTEVDGVTEGVTEDDGVMEGVTEDVGVTEGVPERVLVREGVGVFEGEAPVTLQLTLMVAHAPQLLGFRQAITTQQEASQLDDREMVESVVGAFIVPALASEVKSISVGSPQDEPVVRNTASLCPTGLSKVSVWLPPGTKPVTVGKVWYRDLKHSGASVTSAEPTLLLMPVLLGHVVTPEGLVLEG